LLWPNQTLFGEVKYFVCCARFYTYGFVLDKDIKKDGQLGTVFVVFLLVFIHFFAIPPSAFRDFHIFQKFHFSIKGSSARQIQPFSCRTLSFVVIQLPFFIELSFLFKCRPFFYLLFQEPLVLRRC
jgi:hypothetical protein